MKLSRKALALAALSACAAMMGLSSSASAEVIQSTLGAAGPDNWAVLTLGGSLVADTFAATGPGTTVGNVGATSTTQVKLSGSAGPSIQGNLYLGNTSTVDHPALVSGTIFTNQDAVLNPAAAAAFSARTTFNGMADTFSLAGGANADITGNTTLTATLNGANVTHLSDIDLNHTVLTLNGAGLADAQFVINFSGSINLHGDDAGGKILLTGGLTTHDVIFNYVGAAGGTAIVSSGGSSNNIPNAIFSGVYLVTNSDVNLAPGEIDGEVIGGAAGYKITFASGSQAINPPTSVPVPAALPAGLAGMALMGVWKWRKSRKA